MLKLRVLAPDTVKAFVVAVPVGSFPVSACNFVGTIIVYDTWIRA